MSFSEKPVYLFTFNTLSRLLWIHYYVIMYLHINSKQAKQLSKNISFEALFETLFLLFIDEHFKEKNVYPLRF